MCVCEYFQKQDKFDGLRAAQERHKHHIKQLETIMRMVDNDAIEVDLVRAELDLYSILTLLSVFNHKPISRLTPELNLNLCQHISFLAQS